MDRPTSPKPIPARPPEAARAAASAPDVPPPERPPTSSGPAEGDTRPEVVEATFEHGGSTWWVRVLGRSGSAGGRSPQLLLLGFSSAPEAGGPHVREALVAARSLAELSAERLAEALAGAVEAPSGAQKPFFAAVGQGRRGGPASEGRGG